MPTTKHRTQITHTAEVERALAVAELRWPGEKESSLLLHLITEGADAVASGEEVAAAQRRARVMSVAGKYSDAYGPGYLEDVRAGWDE
jgi:hypothetical protein